MEEEEDAYKATNHEVFFNDKFPIAKKAAATEFLIKAHRQEELDIFLATGKELVVNGLLKEQGIEDIIEPNTFNTEQQDTEQGLYRPIESGDRKHEEDGKYECDQCYNNYISKSSPYLHKQRKNERVRYECDKCE